MIAEKGFLACLLLQPDLYYKYQLQASDFENADYQSLYQTIGDMHRNNITIDPVSLATYRIHAGVSPLSAVISELSGLVPSPANAKTYFFTILNASKTRKIVNVGRNFYHSLTNTDIDPKEAATETMKLLTDVLSDNSINDVSLHESYQKLLNRLKQPKTNPDFIVSGYRDIDNTISGFRAGNLITIAARPGIGKTQMALNLARSISERGKAVGFYTMEMEEIECTERIAAAKTGVHGMAIKNNTVNKFDLEHMERFDLSKHNLTYCELPSISISDLEFKAKAWKIQGKADIIFIDQLSFITGGTGYSYAEQTADIIRRLKILAKTLKIPVILLCQINREGDDRPQLKHLKGSGGIEEGSDIVILLHRWPKESENFRPSTIFVDIAKNRHGPKMEFDMVLIDSIQAIADCEILGGN